MAYTPATKFPTAALLKFIQWALPDAARPLLATGITSASTTISFTTPPKDRDGNIITTPLLIGIRRLSGANRGYIEAVYLPNGANGTGGLSATGAVRGVRLEGLDYTTGDSTKAIAFDANDEVFCLDSSVVMAMVQAALQGGIATGGTDFVIGTEPGSGGETITFYRTTTAGVRKGVFRWFVTNGKAQFSNDGITWVSNDDAVASVLVKVSATDTTASYLLPKLTAGNNVTLTQTNTGGNETITIAATSATPGVTVHEVYTPAFMTGGSSAETNTAIWDSVTNGSFRATIDGTAYNFDGITFAGITTMEQVAAAIQTKMRTVTGTLITCVWSTNHFVITSANTTSASQVSVLTTSTGTVGTDISGAGSVYMDSETGRGTATAAVLNPAGDVGKVPLLNSVGLVNNELLSTVFGGNGADGALNVTSGTTTLDAAGARILVKNYTSINVSAGATLTISNPHSSGTMLILRSQGNVTIAGTVAMNAMGAASGTNGFFIFDTSNHFGAVGGAGMSGTGATTGGAGGAILGLLSSYSLTSDELFRRNLTLFTGSGGGTGGVGASAAGGAGGRGGGALLIECGGNWNFTGTINISGANGNNGTAAGATGSGAGGGGGGSVGSFIGLYRTLTASSGTVTSSGGTGGTGGASSGSTSNDNSGAGGGGAGSHAAGGGAGGNGCGDAGSPANTAGTAATAGSGAGGGGGAGASSGTAATAGGAGATSTTNWYIAQNTYFG